MPKLLVSIIIFLSFSCTYSQNRGGFLYHFHDSSVPPPYHRSYMIDVEDTIVHFVVDSYETILLDETYSISKTEFDLFVSKLKLCKLKSTKATNPPGGCTGGTSESFMFMWNGKTPQDGYTSRCGGKEYGNLKGKIDEARSLFRSMVPDFSNKIQSTRLE